MDRQPRVASHVRPRTGGLLVMLIAALAALCICGAATVEEPRRILTRTSLPGVSGADGSYTPVLSRDGRFVVFVSRAGNLVTNDDRQPFLDIFVRNLQARETRLVSVNRVGFGGGAGNSSAPVISANGRFIAFQSTASDLVEGDVNSADDVFVRDTLNGVTRLASVNAAGNGSANGASAAGLLSADGRWVVFESRASDLGPSLTLGTNQIFARDLWSNTTVLVSVSAAGAGGGKADSEDASITPDARFVAFVSHATDLLPPSTNPPAAPFLAGEVFVRDLQSNTTFWASRDVTNYCPPPLHCLNPAISADGRYLAFKAQRDYTDPGPTVVLRYELENGTLLALGTNSLDTTYPAISADGRHVAFEARNLFATFASVFRWDSMTSGLLLVSQSLADPSRALEAKAPVMTPDGNRVAFLCRSSTPDLRPVTNLLNAGFQLCLADVTSNHTVLASVDRFGAGSAEDLEFVTSSLSEDGTRAAFETDARDLVAEDRNRASDVFVFDTGPGGLELVSERHPALAPATASGLAQVEPECLSADASRLVLSSLDSNLVEGDTNGQTDVFVLQRDPAGDWLAHSLEGMPANSVARAPVISANGSAIALVAVAAATNRSDVRVARTDALVSQLASVHWTGTNRANGNSSAPRLSGDGRLLAFESDATDIVPNLSDGNLGPDIFLRDLQTGTNMLVSCNRAGSGTGTHPSSAPVLSRDGRWVLFRSRALDLATNSLSGTYTQLFVRDLVEGQTRLVSKYSDGSELGGVAAASFSADGRKVLFALTNSGVLLYDLASSTNTLVYPSGANPACSADGRLVAYEMGGPVVNTRNIWLKDLHTGVMRPISTNQSGIGGNGHSSSPVVTHDGRYVVYASKASDLVANDTNGMTDLFIFDTAAGTTLLVSQNLLGTGGGNGLSTRPVLGADGRSVVFQSFASDLVPHDFNHASDLFILRLGARDTDGDGMDDDWEFACFDTLDRNGIGDWDTDGQTDLQEFRAGTDPTNQGSVLQVMTLNSPGTGATMVLWSAVPGRTYQVQFKDEVSGAKWTDVPGTVTATGSTGAKTDTTAGSDGRRFYRVRLVE